ncbi:GRAM domain protein, partial [Ancylostoma caninum]
LRERLDSPDYPPESPPGSVSSQSSTEKKNDDATTPSRALVKKKKYFSEKANNKNIFKKLIHPSYHERAAQYRRLFGAKIGPDPDEFLASYSCAYQREILCQGRMYISQRHICFYANIFGWETNLVVPVSEIAAITKEKAAKIFPNSIQIEMKDETRYFFASFVNREKSLTVLLKVLEKVQVDEVTTEACISQGGYNVSKSNLKWPVNVIDRCRST